MDQSQDDLGDFKLREVVMEDDRFVLYRARNLDEAVVLLKISRAHATPDDLSALSTDFSVARRFDAPSIPRPIRIDTLKGGGTFQVRQHVPGRPLSEWIKERARPAALGEALEIALAIVRALEPLHARGFAHCDISPDNLLYDSEEKVVYFADCARVREHGAIFHGGRRAADNPYLPPEQLLDQPLPVDARTDLFAVGTILQQLLTGEPPGDSAPVDPGRLNLSPGLQSLLDRLLNPVRDRRYASAAAVRRDLTAHLRDWRGRDGVPEPRTAIPDPSAEIRFPDQVFGRESVRSALYSSFVEAIHGLPTLVLVTGDGGSGKSTIMADFRRRIRDEGALVLRGGWTVYDRDIPFRGLAPACLQIVEWFSTLEPAERRRVAEHLKRTLGTGCGVVTEAFPVLEAVLGIQPPPAPTGELERQNRLTYCFTTLLSALGSPERAVVLLLEDLHWADASSLLIVERLPGRSIPAQFLTVATLRTGLDGAAAGTVSALARSAVERGQTVRTLVTEAFHAPDVRAFVAGTLGLSVEEAEPLADLLAAPTLGNPLALRETLSTVMERGLVTFDPAARRWTWDLDGIRQVHLPDNVGQILANRLSALPAGSLEALRAGACLGAKFRVGDLAALLGRSPNELERVLEQPVSDGFIARVGEKGGTPSSEPSWRFRHDLVRRAAYDGLSAEMRRNFHAVRGAALLASHRAGGADE
ncbi:MAG TPA: AAA family ATPase, partial [Polyangia bacterium]|nr:AAA family ATPase [Polyangia bacterium]